MKTIQLHSLSLENFKNQENFVLPLGGKDASIYGDNATGKTSLYDALTWLLFGKDSKGRNNFDIKPLGADGSVKDHTAITAVTVAFLVDGDEITLKRTYYEKWSAKRGSSTETYDGNTNDFFVDGVPVKKAEFESIVNEMVSEDIFRMLTNVHYFCGMLGWKERRETLLSLCGVFSDEELMKREPRFLPLLESGLPTEKLKKKLQAERKALTGIRLDTPARLDELKKTVASMGDSLDFDALRAKHAEAGKELDGLKAELLSVDHDTATAEKKNGLQALQNEWRKLQLENEAYRAKQAVPDASNASSLRMMLDSLTEQFKRDSRHRQNAEDDVVRAEQEVESCRAQWHAINQTSFSGQNCPTCGRPFEGEQLRDYSKTFETEKEQKLRGIVDMANVAKARLATAKKRHEESVEALVSCENKVAETQDKLSTVRLTEQPSIQDMPGYQKEADALMGKIKETRIGIATMEQSKEPILARISTAICTQEQSIATLAAELAKESVLRDAHARINTLTADMKKAGAKMEELDKLLFLLDEFTRYKVSCIEGELNSKFDLVSFRLFGEQVNGGLVECCDVTVGGVPYQSLNSGMQINAGIDVIAKLSAHYGISVPLFTDNSESVTRLHHIGTQVIRLVVSEQDKELRIVQ